MKVITTLEIWNKYKTLDKRHKQIKLADDGRQLQEIFFRNKLRWTLLRNSFTLINNGILVDYKRKNKQDLWVLINAYTIKNQRTTRILSKRIIKTLRLG